MEWPHQKAKKIIGAVILKQGSRRKVPTSVLRSVLRNMPFNFHATRRTTNGASRLAKAMSAWLVKTRRAPSRHSRDARVYGHTTTGMHELSTPPINARLTPADGVGTPPPLNPVPPHPFLPLPSPPTLPKTQRNFPLLRVLSTGWARSRFRQYKYAKYANIKQKAIPPRKPHSPLLAGFLPPPCPLPFSPCNSPHDSTKSGLV